MIPLLLGVAFGVALLLPPMFLGVLAIYYLLTLAYSLRLKRTALIDVLTLAGLYTLRVIAGGAATGLSPSFWLLAFSMFLFLSLALVKRYSELLLIQKDAKDVAAGRGYLVIDLETLVHFGVASGYGAVLVLALYINSPVVESLYRYPAALWFIVRYFSTGSAGYGCLPAATKCMRTRCCLPLKIGLATGCSSQWRPSSGRPLDAQFLRTNRHIQRET